MSGGVVNGNPVDDTYTNSKLAAKDGDNVFLGVQTLNHSGSGPIISDLQQTVNDNITDIAQAQTDILAKIDLAEKGIPNGVATLDALGKIPSSQLTVEVMEYKGTWNASTNAPTLVDGTGSTGDLYRVNVAGSQNLGSGSISFVVGDLVAYNGTIWEKWITSPQLWETEFRSISGGEETAKQLTLSQTPINGAKLLFDIIGKTAQMYSVDYTITGNILDWSGGPLDGELSSGDNIRLHYQY